ncbi:MULTISPECIES: GspE/PulE family protein [unclassified Rhodanobacter]|uniref:GspE/PulE family protein n=1 Tax=unclassified Rhodanobacter TaxID=2621553 RepID=UPI0007A9AC60|nr:MULTISPECIES: GspE/PulE family protein [unclassified Rhodanobacter]KZC15227.1 type II secretion system protein E [Rhodanobacter sp. FW104-R8]KZC26431.1 type II secretion system protein E [Rhodanobacter sp. FW510-T8]KZC32166.1 type II secretion system protein E [Rhodanobacter sp. FW510-R10]
MAASPQIASLLGRRGRLELEELLATLVVDGYLQAEDARQVRMGARAGRSTIELHPLVLIANARLVNQHDPGRPLSLEGLTEWLAGHAGLPYLKIDPMKINVAAVTQVVSHAYAKRHRILPIAAAPGEVTFATCEPFEAGWAPDLAQMLRRDIKRVVASPIDINRYLQEFYGVQRSIQLAQDAKGGSDSSSAILNFEQLVELGKSGEVGADDRHVVHIVDWLLQYAFEQRASDIHLEPRRDTGHMRFRIDGIMQKVFELPSPVMTAVTARIKILARMDVAEKRRPQDGRIKTRSSSGREVELRISNMPTAFGEKVVMRIFDPDLVVKDFAQLGFSAGEGANWRSMVERPHGIVLVTGPTGSGKTTTLYSTLKHLATPELNVCTVEDPIEMVSPEFNQMQVQAAIDLDFAAGVRTLLRQDPDIIMIGEIRDLETAQMAVQASLTGHLVLSTLHTNDAPSAVTRLLDLGVPHYLIQSTLTGVVAQRLVRTLCPHCKRTTTQDPQAWSVLTHGWNLLLPEQVFQPVGCLECRNTGFLGRTGIYEMLKLSSRLRGMISAHLDLGRFGHAALSEGMRPLRISAADQVAAGLTTVQEVLTVLPPIDGFDDTQP